MLLGTKSDQTTMPTPGTVCFWRLELCDLVFLKQPCTWGIYLAAVKLFLWSIEALFSWMWSAWEYPVKYISLLLVFRPVALLTRGRKAKVNWKQILEMVIDWLIAYRSPNSHVKQLSLLLSSCVWYTKMSPNNQISCKI